MLAPSPDVCTGCCSQVSFCTFSEVADMYPAFGSARGPWPFWGYARSVVSLADRPFQPSGLSDSGGVCFPFHACLVRELLWIMTGRQTLAMTSSLWASNGVRCLNTL